ncbi:hypothetical protein EDB89DRAFT_1908324 [Lactarius sanguifluus]|nr:hypothetical protein EDB89DRAFT_1908324 [Lactarius sanguifluus]
MFGSKRGASEASSIDDELVFSNHPGHITSFMTRGIESGSTLQEFIRHKYREMRLQVHDYGLIASAIQAAVANRADAPPAGYSGNRLALRTQPPLGALTDDGLGVVGVTFLLDVSIRLGFGTGLLSGNTQGVTNVSKAKDGESEVEYDEGEVGDVHDL